MLRMHRGLVWKGAGEIKISLGLSELSGANLRDVLNHLGEATRDVAERAGDLDRLGECLRWEADVSFELEQLAKAHKLLCEDIS